MRNCPETAEDAKLVANYSLGQLSVVWENASQMFAKWPEGQRKAPHTFVKWSEVVFLAEMLGAREKKGFEISRS